MSSGVTSQRAAALAIVEALESVVSPLVRDVVLKRALTQAGLEAVPDDPDRIRLFVDGPLLESLAERVGEEVAAELVRMLAPTLRAMRRRSLRIVSADVDSDSGLRDSRGYRTLPAPASLPIVMVATKDPTLAMAIAAAARGRATVCVAEGALELIESIDEIPGDAAIIVDASQPSVHVLTLVAMAPDLAGVTRIVVARASAEDKRSIDAVGETTLEWRVVPAGQDADAIAGAALD